MDWPEKGVYRHYKGNEYELLGVARHSETLEPMAVYRALYGDGGLWVRPLSMWSEMVEAGGARVPRFAPISKETPVEAPESGGVREGGAPEPSPRDGAWGAEASEPQDGLSPKLRALKRYYGYDSFREGQEAVVDAILSGRDVLAVMPTGAGKSVCYQIPALVMDGVALVISPLISLMQDQVQALVQNGVPAAYLNSSLTERQFDLALSNAARGKYRIVYVAPERLQTPRFLAAAREMRISLVAVDEAHCISQWGQDFRPSYLEIPDFLAALPERPPVSAFTATATKRVREDIASLLRLDDPVVQITGFDRKNLYFSVDEPADKTAALLKLLDDYRGLPGIVYCATRKKVDSVCEALVGAGWPATRYHAGLSDAERQANQEDFLYDRRDVMVATNAFGMGIDKSNVRFVVHYNMPKDIESYYQEAGRAGRDGERADCHLLFGRQDILTQQFFIDHMGEDAGLEGDALARVQQTARRRLDAMIQYCQTPDCLRAFILRYFGERAPERCGFCRNCLAPPRAEDVTREAVAALNCVDQMGERYGRGLTVEALRGAETERVRQFGLDRLLNYGALRHWPKARVGRLLDRLEEMARCASTRWRRARGRCPSSGWATAPTRCIARRAPGDDARARGRAGRAARAGRRGGGRTSTATCSPASPRFAGRSRAAASIPPYAVFPDSTLRGLADRKPHDARRHGPASAASAWSSCASSARRFLQRNSRPTRTEN